MELQHILGHVSGFPPLMNIRELGGLRAADGRYVRHGMLFRGATLTNLSPHMRSIVDSWGLKLVFDLRTSNEAEGAADYVPAGASYERIAGMYDAEGESVDFSPAGIMRLLDKLGDPSLLMENLYANMAHDNPAVHALVQHFVAGDAPLYFHCSAGKDRTGVCAAVLLSLLGVDDKTIVQEFLLTNEYRASLINNPPKVMPGWLPDADPESWKKANGVDATNLEAFFAAADKGRPSREHYFAQEFGLDTSALAALRNHYLATQ